MPLQVQLLLRNNLAPSQHQSNDFLWFLLLKSCSRNKLFSSQTPVILSLNLFVPLLTNVHVFLFVLWFEGLFFLIRAQTNPSVFDMKRHGFYLLSMLYSRAVAAGVPL